MSELLTTLRPASTPRLILWLYLLLLVAAEILLVLVSPAVGLGLHALLIIALVLHAALGRDASVRGLTAALLLAPLARTLSLTLPLAGLPQILWFPAILAPLLVAAALVARHVGLVWADIGLRVPSPLVQLMVMGGGLGMGALQYLVLPPEALPKALAWNSAALAGLLLLAALGISEELIFRGLLQAVAQRALGRWALVYVSLLFAAMHIGYVSAPTLTFAFGAALILASLARVSESVVGIALAHALANITAVALMPALERSAAPAVVAAGYSVIAVGTMLAAMGGVIVLAPRLLARRTPLASPLPVPPMRALRRNRGICYVDLAQQTGLSVRLLAEIEHGLQPLAPEHWHVISKALGVSPQQLGAPAA